MTYASVPGTPLRRVDTSRNAPMSGLRAALGDTCPPCYISAGSDCEICPDGADDFPECAGCVNGARTTLVSAAEQSIFAPVIAGVLTALLVAYFSHKFLGETAS